MKSNHRLRRRSENDYDNLLWFTAHEIQSEYSKFSIEELIFELNSKVKESAVLAIGSPRVLVAGCGTGQHAIQTALRFKNSRIVAIDLSLSSLAYAKRKSTDLGITNIEYLHGDISGLDKFEAIFDLVECSGVLHHMENPMTGWKVLTNCLKKGGLMKIGLYSEHARQHIAKFRAELDKEITTITGEELRLSIIYSYSLSFAEYLA